MSRQEKEVEKEKKKCRPENKSKVQIEEGRSGNAGIVCESQKPKGGKEIRKEGGDWLRVTTRSSLSMSLELKCGDPLREVFFTRAREKAVKGRTGNGKYE